MSGPSLDGVWAKYERGVSHLHAFDKELDGVLGAGKRQEIPLDGQVERESALTLTLYWKLGTLPKIEESDCSVIAGDALLNFRSALDQLAWIMVKRKGRFSSLNKRAKEGIQFPLARSAKTFKRAMDRNLPGIGLDTDLGMLVRRHQPYRRGLRSQAMRALRDLTNRDKHRLLISANWHPNEVDFKLHHAGWSLLEMKPLFGGNKRPLKSGAPIMRATVTRVSMNAANVDLKGTGTLLPGVSGGWNAVLVLAAVRQTTKKLIEEATPLL
jgi:hypothetical protein